MRIRRAANSIARLICPWLISFAFSGEMDKDYELISRKKLDDSTSLVVFSVNRDSLKLESYVIDTIQVKDFFFGFEKAGAEISRFPFDAEMKCAVSKNGSRCFGGCLDQCEMRLLKGRGCGRDFVIVKTEAQDFRYHPNTVFVFNRADFSGYLAKDQGEGSVSKIRCKDGYLEYETWGHISSSMAEGGTTLHRLKMK